MDDPGASSSGRTAHDVTALLGDWNRGDGEALRALLPLVYAELRQLAARQLRAERDGHTLQPTALVHEAYLRLVDQRQTDWQHRVHFFGVAAAVMRRILVDHARRHLARKRGAGLRPMPLSGALELAVPPAVSVLGLDEALDRLTSLDPGLGRIIELRAFGGLTVEEAATVLQVSTSTAKRQWRTAKAWLARELQLMGEA